MSPLHFLFLEGNFCLLLHSPFPSFLAWAPVELHTGLSAVIYPAGLPCCCIRGSPLRFLSHLRFLAAECEVHRTMSVLFTEKSAFHLSLAGAWSSKKVLLGFYTGWILRKFVNWEITWNGGTEADGSYFVCNLCLQRFKGFSVFRIWHLKTVTICVSLGRKSISLGRGLPGKTWAYKQSKANMYPWVILNMLY